MSEPLAIFSGDRRYRYTLWRSWDHGLFDDWKPGYVQFIGLNPSTADEYKDDPTLRKCIGFAKRWGYGKLCMTNLFAWRETDPSLVFRVPDPIGEDNDDHLKRISRGAAIIVVAWGIHGDFGKRQHRIRQMVPAGDLMCLGRTKEGFPRHPLYRPYSTPLEPYLPDE